MIGKVYDFSKFAGISLGTKTNYQLQVCYGYGPDKSNFKFEVSYFNTVTQKIYL